MKKRILLGLISVFKAKHYITEPADCIIIFLYSKYCFKNVFIALHSTR